MAAGECSLGPAASERPCDQSRALACDFRSVLARCNLVPKVLGAGDHDHSHTPKIQQPTLSRVTALESLEATCESNAGRTKREATLRVKRSLQPCPAGDHERTPFNSWLLRSGVPVHRLDQVGAPPIPSERQVRDRHCRSYALPIHQRG